MNITYCQSLLLLLLHREEVRVGTKGQGLHRLLVSHGPSIPATVKQKEKLRDNQRRLNKQNLHRFCNLHPCFFKHNLLLSKQQIKNSTWNTRFLWCDFTQHNIRMLSTKLLHIESFIAKKITKLGFQCIEIFSPIFFVRYEKLEKKIEKKVAKLFFRFCDFFRNYRRVEQTDIFEDLLYR